MKSDENSYHIIRPVKRYSIEQFMQTTRVSASFFFHDEKSILVSSNKTGVFNAFAIPTCGGPMRQLTYSTDDDIRAVSAFPNDPRIVYAIDKGGIESRHLCVLEEGGKHVDLTSGEGVKAGLRRWSRDGRYFYCVTNERDQRYFDVYRVDSASYERTFLFEGTRDDIFFDITNDEKYAVFVRNNADADNDIYVYDVEKNVKRNLTSHENDLHYNPAYFDRDSRYLYYSMHEGNGLSHLYRCELATGEIEHVRQVERDLWSTYLSFNDKYRVVWGSERARTTVEIYDTTKGERVVIPSFPEGDIKGVAISRSERLMAFYVNGDRTPNDLYLYEFSTKEIRKLTSNLNPVIKVEDLVESDEVSFSSFDGLEIPCLLWKPHDATEKTKVPALVWVHGGPSGQTRKGYAGAVQFLVNHGYVVLGVNHRGSCGYGKKFMATADRRQGREPLWDCVEAKRYLATLNYVDESKIGIIGGSFGGYMTLAALAFHPEEFAVGVDIDGVSNWIQALELLPPESLSRKLYYEKVGDPSIDSEMLHAISPLFHARNIVRPLLVLQGAKDPRVHRSHSDDIVAAIRNNGGTVEYIVFEDEAHGFRKRANAIRAYGAVLDFLDRHLKNHNKNQVNQECTDDVLTRSSVSYVELTR